MRNGNERHKLVIGSSGQDGSGTALQLAPLHFYIVKEFTSTNSSALSATELSKTTVLLSIANLQVPVEGGIVISRNGYPKPSLWQAMSEFMPPMEDHSYYPPQSDWPNRATNEIGMVLVGGTGVSVFHQIEEEDSGDFGVAQLGVIACINYSNSFVDIYICFVSEKKSTLRLEFAGMVRSTSQWDEYL
ncbi:unnamed protein product [Gongylonema pulchrum]|uniref:Dirigent protein n=1 Tax=Gongylonema pulchrum TaxID=637853 RepID=A0A183DSE0_9BILA|nr:unnamed protein product [Gongylonema pulchrum]